MFENDFGEKFYVYDFNFGYNIKTSDNPVFDRIINPFEMNTSFNYPYEEDSKNDCCYMGIDTDNESFLLIFKTKLKPSYDDLYEIYYDSDTDSYPITYTVSLKNNKGQLVVMNGISIMILNINNFDVIDYTYSNSINDYGINLFYIDGYYIVEDIHHKFTFFDERLKEKKILNLKMMKIRTELEKESRKKYWYDTK